MLHFDISNWKKNNKTIHGIPTITPSGLRSSTAKLTTKERKQASSLQLRRIV